MKYSEAYLEVVFLSLLIYTLVPPPTVDSNQCYLIQIQGLGRADASILGFCSNFK